MKRKRAGITIITALFICALCAPALAGDRESAVTQSWGTAYTAAKQSQIMNPDAGETVRPVEGFDGKAAEGAVEGYHESFAPEKQAAQMPSSTTNINIGELSGIASQSR